MYRFVSVLEWETSDAFFFGRLAILKGRRVKIQPKDVDFSLDQSRKAVIGTPAA